ncbi:hypothetical protein ABPG72_003742 [Tetrahymena utriculariae]
MSLSEIDDLYIQKKIDNHNMSFTDAYGVVQSEKRIKKIISEDTLHMKLDQLLLKQHQNLKNYLDTDSQSSGFFSSEDEIQKKSHYRNCLTHKQEKLTLMCSDLYCQKKGPICHVCLLEDHSDHLEKTGDLDYYLHQIDSYLKLHKVGQSKQEDINDILIDFKFLIDQQKKKITLLLEQIDNQAKAFIQQIKVIVLNFISSSQENKQIKSLSFKQADLYLNRQNIFQTNQFLCRLISRIFFLFKENSEKDTAQIIHVINRIQDDQNKMTTSTYIKEIGDLTQYFEFYSQTKQIYRKEVMRELFLNKIQNMINEKTDIIYQNIHGIYKSLYKILDTLNEIQIQKHKIQDFPKINLEQIEKQQRIKIAHLNWIRNVVTFEMTDYEIDNLGIRNEIIDNVCIVSCSDDMTIKFWVNYAGEGPYNFRVLKEISQAHDKEIFVMRVQLMNNISKKKLIQTCSESSNILLTGQNGKIKIWNWVLGKCVNEIQTRSQFLNDFILLENPQSRLVCNSGGKNLIVLIDWAIFDGLTIRTIHPKENGREIVSLCRIERKSSAINKNINIIKKKIDAFHQQILEENKQGRKKQQNQIEEDNLNENEDANGDLFAVCFAGENGVVKVYNQNGDCLNTLERKDSDWAVCLESMKVLKYYPKATFGENQVYALVTASDSSTLSVYTNREVFKKEKAHEGMIRGLCVWEVRDGLNLRNIILTAGDQDVLIKMWEGVDGQLLRSINASQSGLRWRSLTCYQPKKLDKQNGTKQSDQYYIVFGSKHGTIYIFGASK